MKKFFVALAVVAMTAGFAANAANDDKCCDKKDATKCEQTACKDQKQKACPMTEFQGLELTDAQKTQLKALKDDQKAARTQAKKDKQDKKDQKARMRSENRREYLAKVKAILTPEQYVKYLENQVVDGHKAQPMMRPHAGKGQMNREKAQKAQERGKMAREKAQKAVKAQK